MGFGDKRPGIWGIRDWGLGDQGLEMEDWGQGDRDRRTLRTRNWDQ